MMSYIGHCDVLVVRRDFCDVMTGYLDIRAREIKIREQNDVLMSPYWKNMATKNWPIKPEPLVGFLRHFVGRETVTFSTVRKYKEVSVSFNVFQKKNPIFFENSFFLKK